MLQSLVFLCILLVIFILVYFNIYFSSISFTVNKAITGLDRPLGLKMVEDFLFIYIYCNFFNLLIFAGGTYSKH